jgi:hypothetical protein
MQKPYFAGETMPCALNAAAVKTEDGYRDGTVYVGDLKEGRF